MLKSTLIKRTYYAGLSEFMNRYYGDKDFTFHQSLETGDRFQFEGPAKLCEIAEAFAAGMEYQQFQKMLS